MNVLMVINSKKFPPIKFSKNLLWGWMLKNISHTYNTDFRMYTYPDGQADADLIWCLFYIHRTHKRPKTCLYILQLAWELMHIICYSFKHHVRIFLFLTNRIKTSAENPILGIFWSLFLFGKNESRLTKGIIFVTTYGL